MDLPRPDHHQCKQEIQLTIPSFGDEAEDNNRIRAPRTQDNPWYNNSPQGIQMQWTLVPQPEKPSPKQIKKNTGKKAAALSAISKATLLGIALAKRFVLTPPEPLTPPKLPALSWRLPQRKQQPPALPPKSAN